MKYRGYIRIGFKSPKSAYSEGAFTSYSFSQVLKSIHDFAKNYGINLGFDDIPESCADESYECYNLGSSDSYLECCVRKLSETDI